MKKKILLLGFVALISGSSVCAVENTTLSGNFPEQSCGLADNRLCDSITDDLMKDLLKKTIYSVGTQVLNKYMNTTGTSYYTPVAVPSSTVATPTTYYTPTTTTVAPVTTTTPASNTTATTTTTNTMPQEQMIIIN